MKLAQNIFSSKTASVALIALFFFAALPSQETFAQTKADSVYMTVDEQPVPPGGMEGWNSYIAKNLKYPEAAKEAKTEGTVAVTFVIMKNGEISNIDILRGIGYGCDEEVMRLVKESPKWTPGKIDGKPVKTRMRLPVNFKL